MEVVASTGSEAYVQLMDALLSSKGEVSPRGFDTREILNSTVIIENAEEAHVASTARHFNRRIAGSETIQLLAGLSSLEQLDFASGGRFTQFSDNGRLMGAYGPRTYRQLANLVQVLQKQPDTRQAYFTIWNGQEHVSASHDVACTTGGQFLIRDGKLHLRVSMRSSDVFLGIPYDWLMFSRLQLVIAECLDIPAGSYAHSIGSQHLYERDVNQARAIVDHGVEDHVLAAVPPALVYHFNSKLEPWQRFQQVTQLAEKIVFGERVMTANPDERWYHLNVPQLPLAEYGKCLTCRYVIKVTEMACEWKCKECGE